MVGIVGCGRYKRVTRKTGDAGGNPHLRSTRPVLGLTRNRRKRPRAGSKGKFNQVGPGEQVEGKSFLEGEITAGERLFGIGKEQVGKGGVAGGAGQDAMKGFGGHILVPCPAV